MRLPFGRHAVAQLAWRYRRFTLTLAQSIEKPAGDAAVGVDAAVAQEGPVAPGLFERVGIALRDQDLFAVMRAPRPGRVRRDRP